MKKEIFAQGHHGHAVGKDLCHAWERDGYRGEELKETARKTLGCQLEVVLSPDESSKKFNVIPLWWIVERFFAWLCNFRKIALDYEFSCEFSEAMIQIAFSKNHA